MGRSFRRKAAEVILPPKSASLMPYSTRQVSLALLAISPPTFILLAQEQAFPRKGLLLHSGRWDLWAG